MKKLFSILCVFALMLSLTSPMLVMAAETEESIAAFETTTAAQTASSDVKASSQTTSLLPSNASDFICVDGGDGKISVSEYGDGYKFSSTGGWPAAHYMGDEDEWAKAYINQECYLNWDFEVKSGSTNVIVYFAGQPPMDQAGVGVGESINYLINPANNNLASGATCDLPVGKYKGSVHVKDLGCREDLILSEYDGDPNAYFTISGMKVFAVSDGDVIVNDLSVGAKKNSLVETSSYVVESPHPYYNDMDQEWEIYRAGATSLGITFSSQTAVESGYDYIHIYDEYYDLYGSYTGTELAGKTVYVNGDTAYIVLDTDHIVTDYGFAVTDVQVLPYTVTVGTTTTTDWWYDDATTAPPQPTMTTYPWPVTTAAPVMDSRPLFEGSLLPADAGAFTCVSMGDGDVTVSEYGDGYKFSATGGWPAAHYMGDEDEWAKAYINQECYLNWDFEVKSGGTNVVVYFAGQNPTYQAGRGVGESINYLIDPANNTLASGQVIDLPVGKYKGSVHVKDLGCREDLILSEDGDTASDPNAYFTISGMRVFAVGGDVIVNDLSVVAKSGTTAPEQAFSYNIYNNGTLEITGYDGYASHLVIPDTIEGLPVVSIADYAFAYNNMYRVTIPDSVTTIGSYAFYECYSLTSVTIPDSVTTIGDGAFFGCESLQSVTIPDSVTTIGDEAFSWCTSLQSVTIPDSVMTIGDRVFYSCYSLTVITVDESNTAYCDVDGVLFTKDMKTLVQYPVGKTATSYTIPDSVTTIGDYAFRYCDSLQSVTIPDSVTTIGDSVFSSCHSLQSVTIPDSVTTIGDSVFSYCDSLTSVTIPDSVTTIGEYAFESCYSLSDVYYGGTQSQWSKIDVAWGNDALYYATIHYETLIGQTESFRYVITNNAASIEEYFGGETVVIPATIGGYAVTGISNKAFQGHSELKTIELPSSIQTIGERAFDGCSGLANVYYGGSESQWNAMTVGEYNYRLFAATRHYNSSIPSGPQGDWDGNGALNMMDALNLYSRVSLGTFPTDQTARMDMNGDGLINMMDALLLYTAVSY